MNHILLSIVSGVHNYGYLMFGLNYRLTVGRLLLIYVYFCGEKGNILTIVHTGAQDSRLASKLTSLQAKISSSRMILFSW